MPLTSHKLSETPHFLWPDHTSLVGANFSGNMTKNLLLTLEDTTAKITAAPQRSLDSLAKLVLIV